MVGLSLGLAGFSVLVALPAPAGLSPAAWATAAVAVLMATWWVSEALPLAATALLPLFLLPLLGISDVQQAAAPFANPLIFLFLGGFLIALSLQRWGLHRRLALLLVSRIGRRPVDLVAGVMLATALLSMWISNTATAMMMLPIAASLIDVADRDSPASRNFATATMLGVAYAASIGGLATLIGSPPNALAASYLSVSFGVEVTFAGWMALALPVAAAMLPLAWLILTRVAFPIPARGDVGGGSVAVMLKEMGPLTAAELRVALVFGAVALGWMLRPLFDGLPVLGGLTDTGIAIAGAIALFAIPADWRSRTFLLDWPTARQAPWEILILFGGGLSLAQAIDRTGLATWLGRSLEFLGGGPPILLLAGVTLFVLLLTELTSNTATAAAFLPVVGSLALGGEHSPLLLAVAVALAASAAFMLPVATPPNAIVFGSGHVTLAQMMRAGILLNLCGVIVITGGLTLIGPA